jgi:pimeloyl-ACP methyl ester carboxylesterase
MEGHLQRDGHTTWYRVVGDLDPDALHAPVVICHGGPGATHDYVEPIAELHRSGRACVLYDQLGNGRSDHLPDADRSFWTTQLFKDELAATAAVQEFYTRYVCRLDPWPDALVRSFDQMEADPTVYGTMNGPSEFTVIGPLREWTIVDRLGEIDVPLLLISGEHDEVRPDVVRVIDERVPNSEWVLFEGCSHTPHLEAPDRFLRVVEDFLARVETPA